MKKFYESKLFWLGVIQTLIGVLNLVADFLSKGDFTSPEVVLLFSGALTIVLRIWFTTQEIQK